jgi:hypothetical protein
MDGNSTQEEIRSQYHHQRLDSTASFKKSKSTSKSARAPLQINTRSLNTTVKFQPSSTQSIKKVRNPSYGAKLFSPCMVKSSEARFKTNSLSNEKKPFKVFIYENAHQMTREVRERPQMD